MRPDPNGTSLFTTTPNGANLAGMVNRKPIKPKKAKKAITTGKKTKKGKKLETPSYTPIHLR